MYLLEQLQVVCGLTGINCHVFTVRCRVLAQGRVDSVSRPLVFAHCVPFCCQMAGNVPVGLYHICELSFVSE
jgi:hypothetical protein